MINQKPISQLSPPDLENLSAYLDGQLTASQAAQLKSRLARDADLREALEALRLTRFALRHTPRVNRRRNFVLMAEMVQKQRVVWRAFSASRIVAVAASVIFAVMVGGEVLLGGRMGSIAMAPNAEPAILAQGDAAEVEASGIGGGPAATEAPMEMAMEAPTEAPTEAPLDEPMAAIAPEATPETSPGAGDTAAPTEEAVVQATDDMASRVGDQGKDVTEEPITEENALQTEAPAADAQDTGEGFAVGGGGPEDGEPSLKVGTATVPVIRVVEGGLLGLAVIGGALAAFLRRKAK